MICRSQHSPNRTNLYALTVRFRDGPCPPCPCPASPALRCCPGRPPSWGPGGAEWAWAGRRACAAARPVHCNGLLGGGSSGARDRVKCDGQQVLDGIRTREPDPRRAALQFGRVRVHLAQQVRWQPQLHRDLRPIFGFLISGLWHLARLRHARRLWHRGCICQQDCKRDHRFHWIRLHSIQLRLFTQQLDGLLLYSHQPAQEE